MNIDKHELMRLAKAAMTRAYAPYSKCYVGAALLTKSGEIFTGCNIENAAFTPTICAERAAFGTAVTAGHREFAAVAVAGGKDGVLGEPFYPCGVCRQVMREFCTLDMPVYVADGDDGMLELTLGDILPYSFGKEYL